MIEIERIATKVTEAEFNAYLKHYPRSVEKIERHGAVEYHAHRLPDENIEAIAYSKQGNFRIFQISPESFVEKFGIEETPNENCLEDRACQACGSRGPFKVAVNTTALIFDDGTDKDEGDTEYDETSYAECHGCSECGSWLHFHIPGLDALITERQEGEDEED